MANEIGWVVLTLNKQCRLEDDEFDNFLHEFGASNKKPCLFFKREDRAHMFAKALAANYPGANTVVCAVSDIYNCSSSPVIHRKVTEKGDIIPGVPVPEETGMEWLNEATVTLQPPRAIISG